MSCNHEWSREVGEYPPRYACRKCQRTEMATVLIVSLQQQLDACKEAKEVMHQNMLTVVEAGAGIKQQLEKLEAENARLREAAQEVFDALMKQQHAQTPVLPWPELAPHANRLRDVLGGDDE